MKIDFQVDINLILRLSLQLRPDLFKTGRFNTTNKELTMYPSRKDDSPDRLPSKCSCKPSQKPLSCRSTLLIIPAIIALALVGVTTVRL